MINTPISNFDNIAASKIRQSRMRMREEQNRSTANASWNVVENIVDDDENDIGTNISGRGSLRSYSEINSSRARMTQNNRLRASLIQNGLLRSSSRVSLIQNGLVRNSSKGNILQNSSLKAKGVAMIKKGSQLSHTRQLSNPKLSSLKFSSLRLSNSKNNLSNSNLMKSKLSNAKFGNPKFCGGSLPNSSVMKRNSTSSKYSYKLRDILQSDLKVGATSVTKTLSSTTKQGITRTVSTSQHRRKIRKTNSLHEEFSQDIQILLKSLHSNEFVGTINPQYHAPYVSDQSLM
mmetsp:Transcript_12546/g.29704  ORF Transcript_12546/g.29704 Transcript_12546/m.29704 type:complete len:290 (-) Transcript_12546:254-1123(-)